MKVILTENQLSKVKRLLKESTSIQKKEDFNSVGKGGVNNPDDVEYILNLFSTPKIGLASEVIAVKKSCNPEEEVDYKKVGECAAFHKFIADYQKEHVFPSGFSDSRIDSNRDTITNLHNRIFGIKLVKSTYSPEWKGAGNFDELAIHVIDKLEGGYYHPIMLQNGVVKDSRYGSSGETMFGLDRKNGGTMNTGSEGKAFWDYIDANSGYAAASQGKPKWSWNYMAKDKPELKQLMVRIIQRFFDSYMGQPYVSSGTREAVKKDKRLMFHLIYGVWNGAKWFQKFVGDINQYIMTNPNYTSDDLANVAITSRLNSGNSLISQGGNKIKNIFSNL
jgi:hypothetical protein